MCLNPCWLTAQAHAARYSVFRHGPPGKQASAVISRNPLTGATMKIMYHSGARFAIANWIFHFITCKKTPHALLSKTTNTVITALHQGRMINLCTTNKYSYWGGKLGPTVGQIAYKIAYRIKSHIPQISIARVSDESSSPEL